MDTDTTTEPANDSGITHPAVIMIIEGRVPVGGRAALAAFFAENHALVDVHRSMLMRLQWNAEDERRFRAVFEYATERDFEPEDFRYRTEGDVVDYRSRLDSLVQGQPVVTIWRETSRQYGEDLVRAYWDLLDAREWDGPASQDRRGHRVPHRRREGLPAAVAAAVLDRIDVTQGHQATSSDLRPLVTHFRRNYPRG